MSVPVVQYRAPGHHALDGDLRWWERDRETSRVADAVCTAAARIEAQQTERRLKDLTHASLYAGQALDSVYQLATAKASTGWWDAHGLGHRLSWNVIQICIDTVAAKIAKNRPRVMYLTGGGDFDLQRRAKGLTKFTDGLFDAANVYREAQRAFVDGCVFDAGVLKVYADGADIRVERVLPAEIIVDDNDSIYERPQTLYQRKYAHRDLLIDAFGDKKTEAGRRIIDAIKAAPSVDVIGSGRSDMIAAYEGWHLPLPVSGEDGRHVIAIDGAVLFDEPWTRSYYPFALFRWSQPIVGLWGRGLAEHLVGIQLEITKLLRRIQEAIHLMAVPRVFREKTSELPKAKFVNQVGVIIDYVGAKPTVEVAPAMSAEVYAHLDRLYAKAFETARISQLSAFGSKPAGLSAAVALREYHDIENEAFSVVGQRYEQLHLDVARMMIDLAREMYSGKDKRVKAPGTKFLEEVSWKDVDIAEDRYLMRAFPVSTLPTTPAGRLQKVQELLNAGLLEREMALSLLDFPDLEGAVSLHTAALDDAKRIVENIIERGEYEAPEPAQDLALLIRVAQSAYLRARNDRVPEARLDKLQRLMAEARELQAELADRQTTPLGAVPTAPLADVPPPAAPAPTPVEAAAQIVS